MSRSRLSLMLLAAVAVTTLALAQDPPAEPPAAPAVVAEAPVAPEAPAAPPAEPAVEPTVEPAVEAPIAAPAPQPEPEPAPAPEAPAAIQPKPEPKPEPAPLSGPFADLAAEAKAAFTPIGEEEVSAGKWRVADALSEVYKLINPNTPVGAGWVAYLGLSEVETQITGGGEYQAAPLRETLRKLGSGAAGLEREPFTELSEAIESYTTLKSFSAVRNQEAVYARQVDALAGLLSDPSSLATARGGYQAERRLRLLSGLGQSGALIEAAQQEYGSPNLYLDASADLLDQLAERPVDECSPILDCILGTRIRGTGHTVGTLGAETLASHDASVLRLSLEGTITSNTVGVNGPVTIRSEGTTDFTAEKIVSLSDDAFGASPAEASAKTSTRTKSVKKTGGGIGSRFIEKIAKKKVAEKRGQANAIAARRAERRIEQSLNDQIDGKLADARDRYDEKLRDPLRRRRVEPTIIDFRSDQQGVAVQCLLASPRRLAAPDSPPAAGGSTLTARVHESAINRLAAAMVGGATLTRDREDQAAELDVVMPDWAADRDPEPTPEGVDFRPYALRFRSGRPVSLEFGDGLITVTIHAARITVAEENYDGWDLILRFRPELSDDGWRLVRTQEVEVLPTRFDPAAGRPMASKDVALRNNLAKALNEPKNRLPESIDLKEIDLSERDLAIDALKVDRVEVAGGWLSIGWQAL